MSKTYLQVILLFAPAFLMNNVLLCFVRNDGAPQLSMAAMIGGSLSNIVLDWVFIFPLQDGDFRRRFCNRSGSDHQHADPVTPFYPKEKPVSPEMVPAERKANGRYYCRAASPLWLPKYPPGL